MAKILFECEDGVVTIETPDQNLCLDSVLTDLVVPMLRAAGYAESSIEQYIDLR